MKISPWVWLVVGVCVAVIALSYSLFQHVLPNQAQAKKFTEWGEKLAAEEAKMPQAKKRLEDAKQLVADTSDEWQRVIAARTPPQSVSEGGINLQVNRYQLTVHSLYFRDSMQRAVNRQIKSGGVLVVSGPRVPNPPETPDEIMPTYYNYPTTKFPVVIFDLGTVTVRGTWDQISENVRSWSRMPNYLAVADGLQITGTSPNLTATYNLSMVAFIRGKKLAPEVGAGAALASNPAGGGFGGGVPGGVPAGIPGPAGGRPSLDVGR